MSIDFPKEEERILARWKEIDAFLTQVELVRHLTRLSSHRHAGQPYLGARLQRYRAVHN
jgi:hypothetical protein